jgi:hypothetical protein
VKELAILERVVATTNKPEVREKAQKLIAALKAHKARQDGQRSQGGVGDRVIINVQRAADKSSN